jgi:alkaline phosphatase
MGINQAYTAELYKASLIGKIGRIPLTFNTFPVQSYISTFSANHYITCSSAAGTALASGFKTNNGVIGKDTSLTIRFETIAEKAKKAGYKVGIMSSVGINHATPGSFYAHQNSRSMYYDIGLDLAASNFDFFGGGGFIDPKGKNNEQLDAVENARQKGYTVVNTLQGFDSLRPGMQKAIVFNPILYPDAEFKWVIDQNKGVLTLAQITQKAIDLLYNPKGFFMMVEGGKIDWACHTNDAASEIYEVMAMDSAVNTAVEFYKKHPDETLIIVTADHETGGMATNSDMAINGFNPALLQYQKISKQEFERKIVELQKTKPVPGFEEILSLIRVDFGLGDETKDLALSEQEKDWLKSIYEKEFKLKQTINPDRSYLEQGQQSLADEVVFLLNGKAGIGWTTHDHTAAPVPIRAMGPGQERFTGFIDNTQVPLNISVLMGLN